MRNVFDSASSKSITESLEEVFARLRDPTPPTKLRSPTPAELFIYYIQYAS